MSLYLKALIFAVFFLLSCAQKLNLGSELYVNSQESYLSCNQFADDTFRGYIWKAHYEGENCVSLDITDSPPLLLKNPHLFLQIYPFSMEGEEIVYGSSLPIQTLQKTAKKEDQKPLILSQIIDLYLVEKELALDPELFFLDHILEVCDVGNSWQGLQLVIYERQADRDEVPLPVRRTKFLIPPFLIHPEHFREEEGEALAAFHPFLDYIPEYQSQPSAYYDLADQICEDLDYF